MRAHQSLSWTSQANRDSDRHENSAQTHEQAGCHANTKVFPGDRELGVLRQRDQEQAENQELEDGCIKGLLDAIVLGLVLADKEVLGRDNRRSAKAAQDGEDSIQSLASATASFQLLICLNLTTVASSGGADADDTRDHEHDANQVEWTDLLVEAEVESHDVDETGEGEQGGNDTLVDFAEFSKVPGIGHHDQVADVDGDVSEERHQV